MTNKCETPKYAIAFYFIFISLPMIFFFGISMVSNLFACFAM